jgi:hypothetical protein
LLICERFVAALSIAAASVVYQPASGGNEFCYALTGVGA